MRKKYPDAPIEECAKTAEKLAQAGCRVFQKWTCRKCGERVTGNVPNVWTLWGHHEEKADGSPCGFITDIGKYGCNYMVHADTPEQYEALMKHMSG